MFYCLLPCMETVHTSYAHGCAPLWDHLISSNQDILIWLLMCKNEVELVENLLFYCKLSSDLWTLTWSLFRILWFMPRLALELLPTLSLRVRRNRFSGIWGDSCHLFDNLEERSGTKLLVDGQGFTVKLKSFTIWSFFSWGNAREFGVGSSFIFLGLSVCDSLSLSPSFLFCLFAFFSIFFSSAYFDCMWSFPFFTSVWSKGLFYLFIFNIIYIV